MKNAKISLEIIKRIQSGMTLEAAVDAVLGSGVYENIVDDVYETLRK